MEIYQESLCSFKVTYPAFLVYNGNKCSDFILKFGIPERNLIDWAKQYVDEKCIFVDCGAHMGSWSILLAPHCDKVLAFEAQRRTYLQLCGGIALNNLDKKIFPFHTAVGDRFGQVELKIISLDGGGSHVSRNNCNEKHINEIEVEKVPMRTLDSVFLCEAEFAGKRIGLIKIDCEGSELEVLKGVVATITIHEKLFGTKPKIIFECWTGDAFQQAKDELFAFLKNINYDITGIIGYPHMFLAF